MQALFYTGERRESLEWRDVPKPVVTGPHDAIVEPIAVAACDLDRRIVERSPFPGPFVLGHEFTARVVETGEGVLNFSLGDVVLVSFQPSCGSCQTCGAGHSSGCEAVPNGTMYGIGQTGGDWSGAMTDQVRIPWADANMVTLPGAVDPVELASGSDNLADGLRCVDEPLARRPGASVLVAGAGSIALYAIACARFLGAGMVSFASRDSTALEIAESLGAECLPVDAWPSRFRNHDITVDCTGSVDGLNAVLRSTSAYGDCTSASIYFEGSVPVPMFNLNMKGIRFVTGRVNSASQLERVVSLVSSGLRPGDIQPAAYLFDDAIDALQTAPYSRKLIFSRPS